MFNWEKKPSTKSANDCAAIIFNSCRTRSFLLRKIAAIKIALQIVDINPKGTNEIA